MVCFQKIFGDSWILFLQPLQKQIPPLHTGFLPLCCLSRSLLSVGKSSFRSVSFSICPSTGVRYVLYSNLLACLVWDIFNLSGGTSCCCLSSVFCHWPYCTWGGEKTKRKAIHDCGERSTVQSTQQDPGLTTVYCVNYGTNTCPQ